MGHLSPVTCHLSTVTCYMSPVTCHLSPVTCHLSPDHQSMQLQTFINLWVLLSARCVMSDVLLKVSWIPPINCYGQKMFKNICHLWVVECFMCFVGCVMCDLWCILCKVWYRITSKLTPPSMMFPKLCLLLLYTTLPPKLLFPDN